MVGCSRGSLPTWMTAAAARVDLSGGVTPSHQGSPSPPHSSSGPAPAAGADQQLGLFERALSAAGAAFVSAIIVNPLDVAKVGSRGTPSLMQASPPTGVECYAFASASNAFPVSMQTRLQAQAAGVLYHQPAQMAALGPDAVRNPVHSVLLQVY